MPSLSGLSYRSPLPLPVDNVALTQENKDPSQELATLRHSVQSVLLSTVGEDNEPHTGYTPFIFDPAEGREHHLIIFVSQLAVHTRDLLKNNSVSTMLIADESSSEQIFARTRATYQCHAEVVDKSDAEYEGLLDSMQAGHGKMIGLLRTLPDFVLFRLIPLRGQFTMGFGQAFKMTGAQCEQLEHTRRA